MKITGTLTMALDFGKFKDAPHERYSYRKDGHWWVVSCGPTYSNTFRVTGHDAEGLAWLEAHQLKDSDEPKLHMG